MTPIYCDVTHNPPFSYGDCLRACVATILNLPSLQVPHFFKDGGSGDDAQDRARVAEWMATQGYAPFYTAYDGSSHRYEILQMMGENNPTTLYVLMGCTGDGGSHAVVCRGDRIVHNPCAGLDIVKPMPSGAWVVMGICVA